MSNWLLDALLISFGGGIFLASLFTVSFTLTAIVAAGLFLIALIFRGESGALIRPVVLVLAFFAMGMAAFSLVRVPAADDISHLTGREVRLEGKISELRGSSPLPGGRGVMTRYVIDVRRVTHEGGTREARGAVYASFFTRDEGSAPHPRPGDIVSVVGKLKPLRGYKNPGMIDTVRLARAKGITARLSARGDAVRIVSKGTLFPYAIHAIREHYVDSMRAAMPESDAAAIFAMLFGGYEGIRPELTDSFTITGIVHILSVSGSHITLLAAAFSSLTSLLRLRRDFGAVLVVFAIFCYVALSGFVVPAIRSGIMGALVFAAGVFRRESDSKRLLTLTALVMLFINPWLLFDVSFELSFASTAGLLYIAPRAREFFSGGRVPRPICESLAMTFGAHLAVMPIVAWYFHTVSLSAFLANIIVVPIVEFMIILGLAAGLVGFFAPPFARVAFAFDSLMLGLVYEMTRTLAALPMSQVYVPAFGLGAGVIYYALLMFTLSSPEARAGVWSRVRPAAPFVIFPAIILLAAYLINFSRKPGEVAVHFIDVGQGDSSLIVTPHGRAIMIDTGGTRDGAFDIGTRVDVPYLLHYGVHALDYILLTHAHEDHAAGAAGVIRHIPVGGVLTASEGFSAYQSSTGLSVHEMESAHFRAASPGTRLTLDGVEIDLIFSPRPSGKKGGNEFSNVWRVSYGRASFLFTGDLEKDGEAELLRMRDLRSTVLKVGHHGSKTSTTRGFLAAVSPKFAVIGVGADNTFGHPAPETLASLQRNGVKTYRTDEDGAVVFYTDGEHIRVETYAGDNTR